MSHLQTGCQSIVSTSLLYLVLVLHLINNLTMIHCVPFSMPEVPDSSKWSAGIGSTGNSQDFDNTLAIAKAIPGILDSERVNEMLSNAEGGDNGVKQSQQQQRLLPLIYGSYMNRLAGLNGRDQMMADSKVAMFTELLESIGQFLSGSSSSSSLANNPQRARFGWPLLKRHPIGRFEIKKSPRDILRGLAVKRSDKQY